jgi:hypothetical protein
MRLPNDTTVTPALLTIYGRDSPVAFLEPSKRKSRSHVICVDEHSSCRLLLSAALTQRCCRFIRLLISTTLSIDGF